MPTTAEADPAHRAGSGTVLALKEWGAAVHALLDGRQRILLRKGGIHEKSFDVALAEGGATFALFPTVAHSHAERVRPEHRDVLSRGAADVADGSFVVRAAVELVGAVTVEQPERLPELADLHIWTDESVRADRLEFRPRHPLHVLVVRTFALPEPVVLDRRDEYGGCRSWIDLPLTFDRASSRQVVDDAALARVAARVRATVGAAPDRPIQQA